MATMAFYSDTWIHSSFGERASAAAGRGLWNSLPSHLSDADLRYSRFRTFQRIMMSIMNEPMNEQNTGARAQSTLWGQDIFARKYTYDKLAKCPNFA